MEIVRSEDGFNVVAIQCDGCGKEIEQVEDADDNWFEVTISPLARDKWNAGDDRGKYHFCSRECYVNESKHLEVSPDPEVSN